ncbi:MAG: hypothetical protein V7678_05240 [Brevundimonas sp.]
MIRIASIAAAVLALSAPALAQDAAAQPGASTPDSLRLPLIQGVSAAPDCGGLYDLAGRFQCMTGELSLIGDAAEVYVNALLQSGWDALGGAANQAVFQRRAEAGCDVLEMITFYDFDLPEDQLAGAPGYIGLAMSLDAPCLQAGAVAAPGE